MNPREKYLKETETILDLLHTSKDEVVLLAGLESLTDMMKKEDQRQKIERHFWRSLR